jgi:hypothetical protein
MVYNLDWIRLNYDHIFPVELGILEIRELGRIYTTDRGRNKWANQYILKYDFCFFKAQLHKL